MKFIEIYLTGPCRRRYVLGVPLIGTRDWAHAARRPQSIQKGTAMSLKIKALGLGLIAALALSAVAVLSASAETGGHFTSEQEHVILVGSEGGAEDHTTQFNAPELSSEPIQCTEVSYTGTIQSASKTVTEATIQPTYKKCWLGAHSGEPNATVKMNECDYVFTVKKLQVESSDSTVHVVCPEGKKIELVLSSLGCTLTIPAQTPAGGVVYKTKGTGQTHELTVEVTVTGITYEAHSGFCIFVATHHTDGKLTGSVTVKGTNTAGEQVGITATGES
jgi:hypothetical protein